MDEITSYPALLAPAARPASLARSTMLRVALLAGLALATLLAARVGNPAAHAAADPGLAHLLRGMALIKAAIVAAASAAVWWRLGRPVATAVAVGYVAGCSLLAAAAMLVWQLTGIAWAALGFHVVEISLLILAWREHRADGGPRPSRS